MVIIFTNCQAKANGQRVQFNKEAQQRILNSPNLQQRCGLAIPAISAQPAPQLDDLRWTRII